MRPTAVVEAEVSGNACQGCGGAVIGMQIDLLVLDGFSEPLHEHVVAPAALAVHADSDAAAVEYTDEGRTGELAALIGVHHFRHAIAVNRLFERLNTAIGRLTVGHAMTSRASAWTLRSTTASPGST